MERWDEMALVGRIARTHGNRGSVIVNPDTDFVEARFAVGSVLYLDTPDGPRALAVTAFRMHQGRPVVAFDGVGSMTEAEALAGAELRVPEADLAPLGDGEYYRHDLVGCAVLDDAGTMIGRVRAVDGSFERSQLVVDGDLGEILIPLVAGICQEIDVGQKRIVIRPPEGLLTVNAKGRTDV